MRNMHSLDPSRVAEKLPEVTAIRKVLTEKVVYPKEFPLTIWMLDPTSGVVKKKKTLGRDNPVKLLVLGDIDLSLKLEHVVPSFILYLYRALLAIRVLVF